MNLAIDMTLWCFNGDFDEYRVLINEVSEGCLVWQLLTPDGGETFLMKTQDP